MRGETEDFAELAIEPWRAISSLRPLPPSKKKPQHSYTTFWREVKNQPLSHALCLRAFWLDWTTPLALNSVALQMMVKQGAAAAIREGVEKADAKVWADCPFSPCFSTAALPSFLVQ